MQIGRYIRAVSGHNNLLYHLHNIDNNISELCRFCLEGREEFHHLATDCPPLWWERHEISSQDTTSAKWTPQQILDFTMIPKINEAFAKPLYVMEGNRDHHEIGFRSQRHTYPEITNPDPDDPTTDGSVMDVSSLADSDTDIDSTTSMISIISEENIEFT